MSLNEVEVFTRAAEILENQGYESSVYEDYSGRAMYGATCTGITTDASGPRVGMAVAVAVHEIAVESEVFEDPLEIAMQMCPSRTDSMGLSTIYY